MISTKNLVVDISTVPSNWIFEHYARLQERLAGQQVKIKSLFNDKDRTPSFSIFWSRRFDKYWFHDFSTGLSGDGIKLVMLLHNCNFRQACAIIQKDYGDYLANPGSQSLAILPVGKYQVAGVVTRGWNVLDQAYWTGFNIGSSLLEQYQVKPLEQYTMERKGDPSDHFTVWGEYLYGFFTASGELYKIYRPRHADCKFIKVAEHVQGMDQLGAGKCLIITSSLKDGLSLKSLGLTIDFVAPDSESAVLSEDLINQLQQRYDGRVMSLLDNDPAGIKAMGLYRTRYQIPPVLLPLAKDVSDSVREYGPVVVRDRVVPRIHRILYELEAVSPAA